MKREAGRPGIDPAFRIRAKAWFIAVSQASGMKAGDLEIHFAPPHKQEIYRSNSRPGLWDKYKSGRICPKFKPDLKGRPSIVERVESEFPGTAAWITMPFWQVLSETPMGMDELKEIYLSLSESVCDLIVADELEEDEIFWRKPIKHIALYNQLSLSTDDLDAATAVLALIKEAEITQNQDQHMGGLECWAGIARTLRNHPVLSHVMNDINKVMANRFILISYPDENGKYGSLTEVYIRSILR